MSKWGIAVRSARLAGRLSVHAVLAWTAAAVVVSGVAAQGASASATSSVKVFVGYADTLRANPVNFPTPWSNSPGVIFRGCKGQCTFDASAVMIVNDTPIQQRVDSVHVRIGGCNVDLWPGARTLAPGNQMILTQTASTPVESCGAGNGSIDGSEIAPLQCGGNDHLIPQVDLSLNGLPTTFSDTGQALISGGGDPGCRNRNESSQWTLIGGARCAGGALTLGPRTQSHAIHQRAVVQARFTNGCGTGLKGVPVGIVVARGPNTKRVFRAVTNGNGTATIAYRSNRTGVDRLFGGAHNPAGVIWANAVSVRWTGLPVHAGRAFAASVKLAHRHVVTFADTRLRSTTSSLRVRRNLRTAHGRVIFGRRLHSSLVLRQRGSFARAWLSSFSISLKGLVVRVVGIDSRSSSTCKARTGHVSIRSLTINGQAINLGRIRRNTVVRLGKGITITLNERRRVGGARGVAVNGLHLRVRGLADVILASARSEVRHC
jgi:hypothetical protein